MAPIDFLQSLLKINRAGTILIMTGMGVFAAATVVVGWTASSESALTLGSYILGFGVLAAILTFIVNNPIMKTVIGWMFIVGFGLIMALAFDSVLQLSGRTPHTACLSRILSEPPFVCQARFENGEKGNSFAVAANSVSSVVSEPSILAPTVRPTDPIAPSPVAPLPEPVILPETVIVGPPNADPAAKMGQALIYLQFVPPITRETAIDIAAGIESSGWSVTGGTSGGEEVKRGPSQPQVRYYSADFAETAGALAQDLSAQLGGAEVIVNDFSSAGLLARPNLLEIWVTE